MLFLEFHCINVTMPQSGKVDLRTSNASLKSHAVHCNVPAHNCIVTCKVRLYIQYLFSSADTVFYSFKQQIYCREGISHAKNSIRLKEEQNVVFRECYQKNRFFGKRI
jgi:hypothetical protein